MTLWRKESMDGIFGASESPEKCPHCNSSWDNGERLHTGDDAGIGGYEDWMYCATCDEQMFFPVVHRPGKLQEVVMK